VLTITLQDLQVPALGFGTFGLPDDSVDEAVRHAIEVGYRHIDTAQVYRNEAAVGRGIATSGIDRDELFVTTKIWRDHAAPDDVHRTARESLDRLDVGHIDLLLLHWPAGDLVPMEETLTALNEVREAGITAHIGVSNFPAPMLDRAFDVAPIVTDQVEHHPYLGVDAIRQVLTDRGGFLTAYSPIARGQVLDDPVLQEIGQDHDASATQVALAYLLQKGNTAVIPRSSDPDRIAANFAAGTVQLSADDLTRIDGLARGQRLVDPGFAPSWDVDGSSG
jgi:2,5-diketo-D-gluconate reductase B